MTIKIISRSGNSAVTQAVEAAVVGAARAARCLAKLSGGASPTAVFDNGRVEVGDRIIGRVAPVWVKGAMSPFQWIEIGLGTAYIG